MLLPDAVVALVLQKLELLSDAGACASGLDDLVNKPSLGGAEWVREGSLVVVGLFIDVLATEDDFDGSFGSHDSNFSSGPSEVDISIGKLR